CIGVFCDEHTRSTPLDPKLSFCCISYHLGAFGTVWLSYETRCKTGRSSAKVCATKLHWNFSQRTHPIHPIGPKTHVLVSLLPFRCIWDRLVVLQTRCKTGRTSAKLRATKSNGIFRNKSTRSTSLDPKLLFWCVSYRLGAFGTVRLPYKTRCKTDRSSAKVCATKSHWNFSQRNHPIHFIGP